MKQISKLEPTKIKYKHKFVKGKTVSVSSFFYHNTYNFYV